MLDKISNIKKHIDHVTNIKVSFDEWPDEYLIASQIEVFVNLLDNFIDLKLYEDAMKISEYLLLKVDAVIQCFEVGDLLNDLLDEAKKLHLKACQAAKPEALALAKSLFYGELNSDWGVFENSLTDYSPLLGEKGLQTYIDLAKSEWKKVPFACLKSALRIDLPFSAFGIRRIMEKIANLQKDPGLEVEICLKSIPDSYNFNTIVNIYKRLNQLEKADYWSEQALKYSTRASSRDVALFVAGEYFSLGCREEAMQLVFELLKNKPDIENYKVFIDFAKKADNFDDFQQKAVDFVRSNIELKGGDFEGATTLDKSRRNIRLRSLLVEMYLAERDTQNALTVAREGRLKWQTYLNLGEALELRCAREAIPHYAKAVHALARLNARKFAREAVQLLLRIQKIYAASHESERFNSHLQEFKEEFGNKRSVMRQFNAVFDLKKARLAKSQLAKN